MARFLGIDLNKYENYAATAREKAYEYGSGPNGELSRVLNGSLQILNDGTRYRELAGQVRTSSQMGTFGSTYSTGQTISVGQRV